jgi:hypothetical protein
MNEKRSAFSIPTLASIGRDFREGAPPRSQTGKSEMHREWSVALIEVRGESDEATRCTSISRTRGVFYMVYFEPIHSISRRRQPPAVRFLLNPGQSDHHFTIFQSFMRARS